MNPENLVRAAHAEQAAGRYPQAVQLCMQALSANPQQVDALLMLGSFAARQGQVAEAEHFLRRAAEANPNSYDAVRWLTTLLIGRDGGHDAVSFGRRAVQLRPEDAEPYVILGLAAMGAGDRVLAIENLVKATQINPELAGAHHNLGVLYQRDESYEEAVESLRRAVALAPHVLESYLHLGRCYLSLDRGDEALDCAEEALRLKPDSGDAKRLRADARFVAFHGDGGLERIKAAIEEDPSAAFPHALMGSRLQEQGDFEQAEQFARRSTELQPVQGFAYYLLVHSRKMVAGDLAELEKVEAEAASAYLDPVDRQYLHFALGKAYDDLGNYEQAMRQFDLAHEPQDREEGKLPHYGSRPHPAAEMFTPEILERFSNLAIDTEEPIFIFGMPRSGTTLLEQIVSRHSTVGAGGELFFWRNNSRRIVNMRDSALNPTELAKAGRKYLDLLHATAPGKAHITDKFPSNYAYLGLLQILYPKAIFISAQRHPLDVCLSIYMRPFVTNQGIGRTRREIVETFRQYLQTLRHWRETFPPGRMLEVQYEHLVQNPEEMTRKIIAHCRLDWEDACLTPQEGDRRVLTFSKWQVRQPVYTTSVERWRRYEPWLGVFSELLDSPAVS